MRNIYLIRHAKPSFPTDDKYCIGRTDFELSPFGKMQACILGEYFKDKNLSGVFSSPLKRTCQTACFLSEDYVVMPDFRERDFGQFDGLPFSEIKEKWPEIYELRGDDRDMSLPDAEEAADAKRRFQNALDLISAVTFGDIAIVAHNTVIRLAVDAKPDSNLPYCGFYCNGKPGVAKVSMTPDLARKLRDASGMLPDIQKHCDAVAKAAVEIAGSMSNDLDINAIECAALLHDIARTEKQHAKTGGKYLSDLGFEDIGNIISQHEYLDKEEINEAAVVFLADKLVMEDRRVTLEERFNASLEKCNTPESVEAHRIKKEQALRVQKMIGKEEI